MERIEQVESESLANLKIEDRNLATANAASDDSFLDYEDENELDRFAFKQERQKLQLKRKKKALGA